MSAIKTLLGVVCFGHLTSAVLYSSPTEFVPRDYDYIIVGGGTAGSVVASRLTEIPDVSVLVLEAGISHEGIINSQIPLFCTTLTPNTPYDWNYTTTPQAGYNNRSVPYARGRMLGGSSSVNYQVFMRGSADDWNRYAAVSEDDGWNWNNMQQYIARNERVTPPADNHNTTGEFIPSHHGFSNGSAISISLPGRSTPIDDRVLQTLQEQSDEFPFNPDMGGGDVLGIGWMIASIGHGQRSSAATGFLEPALPRDTLDVVVNSHVTKLVQTGTEDGVPSFHCVEFAEAAGAETKRVCASEEIILSAGSIGTPVLLQVSGIGNRDELTSLGIETIVHNPSVGKNLTDHPLLAGVWTTKGNDTLDSMFRDASLLDSYVTEWTDNRTGPLVSPIANHLGWLRLANNASIFETVEDPASGPNSSHWEIIISNFWAVPGIPMPAEGNFVTITTALISPTSRGELQLVSSDPFEPPLINPNFLSTDFDIFALKEAIKAIKRFMSGSAWEDYIDAPYGDFANANTDDEIEAFVRNSAASIYHPLSTAAMSPRGAGWGVVDPDLKVKGVEGLRIVDASVIPYMPNAPTQGPVYLISERGADLIIADLDDSIELC
ncbi:hypothetical protein PC9H_006905 [Pleurotus ostreatus]|uniref:Glucose-methanol-choline oxidoreductase N-terminal domain-containing protein n=1 Tax=Pleurotus ostreatus TaxID=5322 RepID=A0A8H6ZUN7_PLEOS|nr:uncharacterized protein PC9H_006905 [Pleurotus ostreatus]KAF7431184.1 hypothetical protein PC9H_006905 [Pleurotus ostreatus]